ncbi:MAG: beta-glucuronidase [Clostridiales bacterium]|nr:beta-glucuronidase [Clostridiales bacterium]
MVQRIDLSGEWEFCIDVEKQGVEEKFFEHGFNDMIKLPTTTAQARKGAKNNEKSVMYLTEYYHFEGYSWYRKCIELDELSQGQRCFLRMERTRISSVWLNDVFVGTQESLISAHWYDLTDAILACGDNNGQVDVKNRVVSGQANTKNFVANGRKEKKKYYLTVMVSNVDYKAPGGHMTSPDTQTNWNGILGDISLYLYQTVRIADAQIYTSAEDRRIDMKLVVSNFGDTGEGEIIVESSLLKEIRKVGLKKGENEIALSFDIAAEKEIVLWNEFTPSLYQVNICVNAEGCMPKMAVNADDCMSKGDGNAAESSDSVTVTTGFRDLHTSEDCFYLNELPIFLRGKQEGLAFPITGYAPMDTDAWRQRFKIAKDYGLNHYRFHTCCPPEAAFVAADEMGIYLEPEIHFWGTIAEPGEPEYDKARQDYLIEEGYKILQEFGNHPSFLMFSLGNELWGSAKELSRILRLYKAVDKRHWYTQGSNNFQFTPVILEEDDFFCGVRFSKERLFRGSYAMCDAPQGHVQLLEPENTYSYDEVFNSCAEKRRKSANAVGLALDDGTVEIQYQTGTKKVKAADTNEQLEVHIPVVSHEIGQYETYPDFREIERYTGVLGAENFKIFKKRLEDAGMLHKAHDFFKSSGALAVACYKRELETAFRSSKLAGFQLLDLQDFPGQGTSLVGILNAFMESKGLIEAGEWRQFCSERVIMLQFPRYVYQAGENFNYQVLFYNGNPNPIENAKLQITLEECNANSDMNAQNKVAKQLIPLGNLTQTRLSCLHEGQILLPDKEMTQKDKTQEYGAQEYRPKKYRITVEICDTQIRNSYEIYVYPDIQRRASDKVVVTNDRAEMLINLKQGKKVLYLGGRLHDDYSMEGTYCANFWNYPMFASISENMGKEKPIGTMGLCIESTHPAFDLFPTESYTTPQWWKIVTGTRLALLDNTEVEPIVWTIDNFDRNHKIGLIYEAKVGDGSLLVCQKDLLCAVSPEENWLYESLLSYAESERFAPEKTLTEEQLNRLYEVEK